MTPSAGGGLVGAMPKAAVAFLATAQPERALTFYRDTVGLTFLEDSPFALVFDAFGTPLRIQKVPEISVTPYTAFGLTVESIVAEVARLSSLGVPFARYAHFSQDENGIWTAPGGAQVAWFRDPDGHLLSLTQLPD